MIVPEAPIAEAPFEVQPYEGMGTDNFHVDGHALEFIIRLHSGRGWDDSGRPQAVHFAQHLKQAWAEIVRLQDALAESERTVDEDG